MEAKRLMVIAVTAALGAGAALGVAACGDEDREGTVEIEGGTTGTGTVGTATVPTSPETTPTSPPETTPTSP